MAVQTFGFAKRFGDLLWTRRNLRNGLGIEVSGIGLLLLFFRLVSGGGPFLNSF